MHLRHLLVLSLLGLIGSSTALAQISPPSPAPISAAEQNEVVATLGQQLKSQYVFPDVAAKTAAALSARATHSNYLDANRTTAFTSVVSIAMSSIGDDRHSASNGVPFMTPPPYDD